MREKKPYESKRRGHNWRRSNGQVDIFAYYPADPHNGPRCTRCDYGFCHHCQDLPDISCPKRNTPRRKA